MDEKYLQQQLYNFLAGEAGLDPRAFAREVNENLALRRVLSGLSGLSPREVEPDKERVMAGVTRALRARRRARLARAWGTAAAVALLLAGWGGWWFSGPSVPVEIPLSGALVPADSGRVRLLLGSGEVLPVHDLDVGATIREHGAKLAWEKTGMIAYKGEEAPVAIVYNTLVVPRGNEFRLSLADGTEVWVNSETKVRYPVNFPPGTREVHVKGEAFFRVARDSARPFVVMAEGMKVEALGTGFNVNTYRDRGALVTTLVEGSVRVTDEASGTSLVLRPGQQACLQEGTLSTREVNTAETIAWTSGQFLYYDMPLEEIGKQLERWYNVRVFFQEPSLRAHAFTGVVKRYHSLQEICSYIEETTSVHFTIEGRDVVVRRAK
jgi:ferric-dicitrate binding protein FerR (iron transport regulator)